jgi:hypothetical protein
LCCFNEFVAHGNRWGNSAQALIQWPNPVALSEALAVLHWAMCPKLNRHICMAIEIASDLPAFSVVVNLLSPTAIAKKHSKNN